jgi:chemotaxis protein methyltransferase CheR
MIADEINDKCFEDFRSFVHEITGITIDSKRSSMLVGRIRKRVTHLELASYEDYLKLIKRDKDEKVFFTDLITTNETYLYRTPRIWDFIEKEFLPSYSKKTVQIWSAAASTGDEAHTLGVVCQNFKAHNPGFDYRILGTDISPSVIGRAREGIYAGRAMNKIRELRSDLFHKYFKGNDDSGYQVIPSIKDKIRFEVMNLFESAKAGKKFDLILLRNVLIYFTKQDQEKVLENIHKAISPEGTLIIGESESLSRVNTEFESIGPLTYQLKSKKKNEGAA